MTETGHFETEGLWILGSEEISFVLSWDEYNAGKLWEHAQLWEPGINIELLTELLFLFEKPLWRILKDFFHAPVHQAIINIITKFDTQATSLYLSGQWSMDYDLFMRLTT